MARRTETLARELHAWLKENPGAGLREIGQQFGISDNRLQTVLLAGEDCGVLFYEQKVERDDLRGGARLEYFAFVDERD